MQTYKQFRPTGFDVAGLNAGMLGIGDFLVAPVSRNRDSDVRTESNWHAALDALGGESDTVQVHRFGHWACGWFELILIDPAAADKVAIAADLERRLADYPILDEFDCAKREWDKAAEWWSTCGLRERIRVLAKYRISCFAAREDDLSVITNLEESGQLVSYLAG